MKFLNYNLNIAWREREMVSLCLYASRSSTNSMRYKLRKFRFKIRQNMLSVFVYRPYMNPIQGPKAKIYIQINDHNSNYYMQR